MSRRIPPRPTAAQREMMQEMHEPLSIERRCTLCGCTADVPASEIRYCRHGGEWFLMVRTDGGEESSAKTI